VTRVRIVVLLLLLSTGAVRAGDKAPRGLAFLSSSVGKGVSRDEIEDVVRECRLDLVVIDFSWITHHFPHTDLDAVERLADRLAKNGVTVAAMYRPRALVPEGIPVHFARDAAGNVAAHHNQLCFAHEDSVKWGLAWGTRILAACPSVHRMILYNLGTPCHCERCRDGKGVGHAVEFLKACRREWKKVRPDIRIGHVGTRLQYAGQVDFLLPFLSVNRRAASEPVPAAELVREWQARTAGAGEKPVVPLAKICWASATNNTTEDVAAVVRSCDRAGTGFCLWYYGWILHSDDARYDPAAVVRALGGEWEALASHFAKKETENSNLDPNSWIYFDSLETAHRPMLVFHRKGGKETSHEAIADTVVISYLADRAFRRHPRLAVSMGDTNRVLFRFPELREKPFERADLKLSMRLSKIPPSGPFTIAIHRIEKPWDDAKTNWSNQPAVSEAPTAVVTVEPKEGVVRFDVTPLAREWIRAPDRAFGVLLKVAHVAAPKPQNAPAAPPGPALLGRAVALYPFADSLSAALAKSVETGRPVLTIATAAWPGKEMTPQEEVLFSTVLSHPAVVRLVNERFVPVRFSVKSWRYVTETAERKGPDPFAPIGTRLADAKAPSLVVSTGKGKHVATLASIGTYDHGIVLDFLRDALTAAGLDAGKREKVPEGVALMRRGKLDRALRVLSKVKKPTGEETYWRAAILEAAGEEKRARDLLRALVRDHPGDPFALKAEIRLAYPRRVVEGETLAAPHLPGKTKDLVRGAVDYLLDHQRPDGSFPVASAVSEYCRPGVTVLAAHALLLWSDDLDAQRKRRAKAALDRADRWLDEHVGAADARILNSFAAAYYVDYLLERHERKQVAKKKVVAAIDTLVAGVCASGAWAYDRRFGESWKGGVGGWPKTTKGRMHSCNTGPALAALARARKAGLPVDANVIERGTMALRDMRVRTGVYTYTWPEPRNFESEDASIARAPVCELALFRLDMTPRAELRKTLDLFMKHRAGLLKPVKLTPGWIPPHGYSGYFYFFAYYHAAVALADLKAEADLAKLREDLLAVVEPDGTWVDYPAIGKCYGTAMALMVLKITGLRID